MKYYEFIIVVMPFISLARLSVGPVCIKDR